MPIKLLLPLITLTLVACSAGKDSRYRDTEALERPPVLAISKHVEAVECCDDVAAVPKEKRTPGLGDQVELIASKPMHIKIKQSPENAWNTLGLALKQSEIKITDQERDQNRYYVAYRPASFLGGLVNHLNKDVIYLLNITPDNGQSRISAELANVNEQNSALAHFDSDDEEARSDAEDLLHRLYETLHDDLKEPQ